MDSVLSEDLPIDEAWLRSIGAEVERSYCVPTLVYRFHRLKLIPQENTAFGFAAEYGVEPIRDLFVTTRGQLLRLLSSLGITVSPTRGA